MILVAPVMSDMLRMPEPSGTGVVWIEWVKTPETLRIGASTGSAREPLVAKT